jgi:hypothetical protein
VGVIKAMKYLNVLYNNKKTTIKLQSRRSLETICDILRETFDLPNRAVIRFFSTSGIEFYLDLKRLPKTTTTVEMKAFQPKAEWDPKHTNVEYVSSDLTVCEPSGEESVYYASAKEKITKYGKQYIYRLRIRAKGFVGKLADVRFFEHGASESTMNPTKLLVNEKVGVKITTYTIKVVLELREEKRQGIYYLDENDQCCAFVSLGDKYPTKSTPWSFGFVCGNFKKAELLPCAQVNVELEMPKNAYDETEGGCIRMKSDFVVM